MSTTAGKLDEVEPQVEEQQPPKVARVTTYHVQVLIRDEEEGPLWRYLGPVDAANRDAACKLALERSGHTGTVSAQATPDRSWDPEVYTPEQQLRFVKGSVAAKR